MASKLYAILLLASVFTDMTEAKRHFKDCEYTTLGACDKEFMDTFQLSMKGMPSNSKFDVYCKAFQTYADCLAAASCRGVFVDLNRLMILQHTLMDKKLEVCPEHTLEKLTQVVMADLKLDSVPIAVDSFSGCAETIHRKCAGKMAKDFETDNRMCYGVKNFIKCYKESGPSCNAKIYTDFNDTLQRLAKHLLIMFKEVKGVMPNC